MKAAHNILVVEDNVLDLKLISNLLSKYFKYQIVTAKDGSEAVTLLEKHKYSLVITDIIMPNIEGIELINIIKRQHPSMPIIAISSGKPFYLYLAKKLGIAGIFTKPLDKQKFLRKISNILLEPIDKDLAF